RAWLQLEAEPLEGADSHSLFVQTAYFEPKGLPGLLYWYLLYPVHKVIFSGLCREIKRRSEETWKA
ncbi:MAG: DUF2867 domain-containing protein, partial [Deltaproteobacteria bacterium]|nr:DUF2867 domain-containing protein [Deltaproteobacteria bacterium]